jgi:hypothetical protein
MSNYIATATATPVQTAVVSSASPSVASPQFVGSNRAISKACYKCSKPFNKVETLNKHYVECCADDPENLLKNIICKLIIFLLYI